MPLFLRFAHRREAVLRVTPTLPNYPRSRATACGPRTAARARGSLSQRVVIVDDKRCVVAETLRLVDCGASGFGADAGCGELIIDAPSHVLGPGLAAVGPPGVLLRFLVEAAEHVHVAELVEHPRKPLALLWQEAGVLLVGAPVLEV